MSPDSILAHTVPTIELNELTPQNLQKAIDEQTVDVEGLEKRTTLLSRLVIEKALWEEHGWTKKERVDAAIRTIQTLEGAKERMWLKVEGEKKLTHEEYLKEKEAAEARLNVLLKQLGRKKVEKIEVVDAAMDVAAVGEIGEA